MNKKHQKHGKLKKPDFGFFGRNEFSFLGAPCDVIENVCSQIIKYLDKSLNTAYVDADHGSNELNNDSKFNVFQDKISFKRVDKKRVSIIDQKFLLSDQDLILVNGNHFQAEEQVVFIHSKKEASLQKRLSELTDIKAFVLCENQNQIFEWLKTEIPDYENIPIFYINELETIAQYISENCKIVSLKVIILSGGKSIRMGEDKSKIHYHGMAQQDYLIGLCSQLGIKAYVSCREEQTEQNGHPTILDKFIGLGPYGGILSAFQEDPDAAWMVIACDLPLIGKPEIEDLISKRNPTKFATAYFNPETDLPDPLFTIWEPKAYLSLLSYLSLGYSCPRKVLINSNIELVQLPKPEVLKNVNTPEDRFEIMNLIENKR